MKQILYLHGFLSCGAAVKASTLSSYVKEHCPGFEVVAPNIIDDLDQSFSCIENFISNQAPNLVAVVGSCLGGYWSYRVAEKFMIPAVLLNPVVDISALLDKFKGTHVNIYTKHEFEVDPDALGDALEVLQPLSMQRKDNYMVLLGTEDEVLDYRVAKKFYDGCHVKILEGEDHRIKNFSGCCPDIMDFIVNKANNI